MSYEELAARLSALADAHRNNLFSAWLVTWATGLQELGIAADRAAQATTQWTAILRHLPDGPLSDEPTRTFRAAAEASRVESYHEIALIALSQPLLEALAAFHLGKEPMTAPSLRAGAWVALVWNQWLVTLGDRLPGEPSNLLQLARLVDATFGTGRDRLVAHVSPGPLYGGSVRDADGQKRYLGSVSIAPQQDGHEGAASADLRALNDQLSPPERSVETNPGEIARHLMGHAGRMPYEWRLKLEQAAVPLGFTMNFRVAARWLVELAEASVATTRPS